MAERLSGIPDDIQKAIGEAPIDWDALQSNANRLRWKIPEDFDGLYRSVLSDYAVNIGRYLWYSVADQMVQEKGGNLALLPKVSKALLDKAEMDVFRTQYEFGYGLGQGEGLIYVSSAILQGAGIPTEKLKKQ